MDRAPGCPPPETLADYHHCPPEGSAREALEVHAAACPRCRQLLVLLASAEEAEPYQPSAETLSRWTGLAAPSGAWGWRAAAAALLLAAAGLGWLLNPSSAPPSASTPPQVRGGLPDAEGDRAGILGSATLLTLKAGSRMSPLPGGSVPGVRLDAGALWVEAPGEEVLLAAGEARIALRQGVVLLECRAARASAWLPSAHADQDPGWRLCVVEGEATLRLKDGERRVPAGRQVRGGEGDPAEGPCPPLVWKGEAAWQEVGEAPVSVQAGFLALGEVPAGDYVWEALLRREAVTGVSVRLRLDGKGVSIPLGGALLQGGPGLLRVRAAFRDGHLRLQAGSQEVFSGSAGEALRRFPPAPAACGVQSWGGLLEVRQARWRTP